jgi:hypothetical protein
MPLCEPERTPKLLEGGGRPHERIKSEPDWREDDWWGPPEPEGWELPETELWSVPQAFRFHDPCSSAGVLP